jgi:hypothetical protein
MWQRLRSPEFESVEPLVVKKFVDASVVAAGRLSVADRRMESWLGTESLPSSVN